MKITVPSGRARKATAKTANDSSVPVSASTYGKHELRKHHDRGDRVDEEIEVFRGSADDDADRNVAGGRLSACVVRGPAMDPAWPGEPRCACSRCRPARGQG
jgi:hypothetical protein